MDAKGFRRAFYAGIVISLTFAVVNGLTTHFGDGQTLQQKVTGFVGDRV